MIKEAIGYGETIEQAKEDALQALGASIDDDVQFDVISMPKTKVLGIFGGAKAEVKAFIELPDEKPAKGKPQKKNKKEKAPRAEKITEAAEPTVNEEEQNALPLAEIGNDTPAYRAAQYLIDILTKLGCENLEVKVAVRENGAALFLSGDHLGVAIGRRGETLDSLQYLTGLSANAAGGYYKVALNIGDYREKREQALEGLAGRVARQVLKTGRSRTLEPMNPYERRIIHTVVQNINGVSSNSIGEGSNRRVVISSDKPHRRGQKSASNAAPAVSREPKKDAELPLYGKIN